MVPDTAPEDVLQFIAQHVDSVPHLETLLLLWETAPRTWTAAEISHRVYLPTDRTERVLQDLAVRRWVKPGESGGMAFDPVTPDAAMIARLAELYRNNLVRVAETIHRKAPPAVLDFARAFHLRKDR